MHEQYRQLTVLLDTDEYERVQRATVRFYESFAKEDGSGLSNVFYEGEKGASVKIKFPQSLAASADSWKELVAERRTDVTFHVMVQGFDATKDFKKKGVCLVFKSMVMGAVAEEQEEASHDPSHRKAFAELRAPGQSAFLVERSRHAARCPPLRSRVSAFNTDDEEERSASWSSAAPSKPAKSRKRKEVVTWSDRRGRRRNRRPRRERPTRAPRSRRPRTSSSTCFHRWTSPLYEDWRICNNHACLHIFRRPLQRVVPPSREPLHDWQPTEYGTVGRFLSPCLFSELIQRTDVMFDLSGNARSIYSPF